MPDQSSSNTQDVGQLRAQLKEIAKEKAQLDEVEESLHSTRARQDAERAKRRDEEDRRIADERVAADAGREARQDDLLRLETVK